MAPALEASVVKQFHALFVALCKSWRRERSGEQSFELIRQPYMEVTQTECISLSTRNQAAAADANRPVPTNRSVLQIAEMFARPS